MLEHSDDADRPAEDTSLSAWEWLFVALAGTAVTLLLVMGAGTLIIELSRSAGVALPLAENDPERVELIGLLQLSAYGLGALAALTSVTVLDTRLAPAELRPGLHRYALRFAGAAVLGLLAFGGVLVGVEQLDPFSLLLAAGFAYGAVRVARGLPLDDEDE